MSNRRAPLSVKLALCAALLTACAAYPAGKRPRLASPCPCPEVVVHPCEPCLPSLAPIEPSERAPGEEAPVQPAEPAAPSDAVDQALASAFDYAAASDMTAPNMFGDQIGGGSTAIIVQFPSLPVALISDQFSDFGLNPSPLVVTANPGVFLTSIDGVGVGVLSANGNFPVTGISGGDTFILAEDSAFTAVANAFVQGAVGQPGSLQNFQGVAPTDSLSSPPFEMFLAYDYVRDPLVLFLANPADGGVVGRTKIADDNNPLPRDRFIFNYDYFSNVPLTANGWDVHRFSPGFEKTFFNRMTSVEVRFPFASTLDSAYTQGAESTNTEFGDVHITLKALFLGGEVWNVAGGLGISVPTADDTRVRLAGTEASIAVENESVLLQPYLAALWTPTRRLFAQAWLQFNFDANGNPVVVSNGVDSVTLGRLNSQSLLQLDGQIGYWLVQRNNVGRCGLAGFAPFVELHYNTTLNDADAIQIENVLITSLGGRVDELNLTAGFVSQFGDNLNVAVGAVAPLKSGFDRFFDAQVGVRANYFFGPTARARSWATRVDNF